MKKSRGQWGPVIEGWRSILRVWIIVVDWDFGIIVAIILFCLFVCLLLIFDNWYLFVVISYRNVIYCFIILVLCSLFFVFLCSLIHLNHEWTFFFLFVFMYLDLSMLSREMHTIICWYDGHLIAFKYIYIFLDWICFPLIIVITLYLLLFIKIQLEFWRCFVDGTEWKVKKEWDGVERRDGMGKERRVEMGLIWTVWNWRMERRYNYSIWGFGF